MKFILSAIATAALAFVASAAPSVVAREVTTELPARFAMYLVTNEARVNGLRIQYVNSRISVNINANVGNFPPVDGVFLGGRGRIALDRTVHKIPNTNSPTNPEPWGDWNVMFLPFVDEISVNSEERQAVFESWGTDYHPTVGKFVQNSQGLVRLVGTNGELLNGLRICGSGKSSYQFWWDSVPYLNCPVAELRIVPL